MPDFQPPRQPHEVKTCCDDGTTLVDGYPIAQIEKYELYLHNIDEEQRNKIVWSGEQIVLEIRYPLRDTLRVGKSSADGWTYAQLITVICQLYNQIWQDQLQQNAQNDMLVFASFECYRTDSWFGPPLSDLALWDIVIDTKGVVTPFVRPDE